MKNDEKKEITIDDLATMVQNGFIEVNGKIDGINQRLTGVEQTLTGVEQRLDKIETTTEEIKTNLNKKVDKIDHNTLVYRVEKLEKNFT